MNIIAVHEVVQTLEFSFITPETSAFYEKMPLTQEQYEECKGDFLQIQKVNDTTYNVAVVAPQRDNQDNQYKARIHNSVDITTTESNIPEGIPLLLQIPGADFSKTKYTLHDLLVMNNTTIQEGLFQKSLSGRSDVPYFWIYKRVNSEELYIGSEFKVLFYNMDYIPITDSFIGYMQSIDPNYKGLGTFKVPLVQELNANDSFSYADIQLDLITDVVATILEENPQIMEAVIAKYPKYAAFQSMFDSTSIFKLRSDDDLIVKFGETKSHVRKVQRDWYAKKGTLTRI